MADEGLVYPVSEAEGTWRDEVNEGPFEDGEGKNSPLLKASADAAAAEKELDEAAKANKANAPK